ncbi:Synaptogyrin -like protein 1 [Toxocara canis]|uniref:Synaptogyrin-like protein 1 n=1 Tax=Toxocara canis TaxID=6265 RepID=A0A0B2VJ76_TOXCA|nr:Synaptogyrin -like protein 1 [Toxocara canis]
MDNIRAYGAGMAGGAFDRTAFIKKPTVIFRFIALVSGIILWASISNGGWHEPTTGGQSVCLYGNSASACSFGSAMGFFAVVGAIALLIADARFEKISAIQTRKRVVITDLAISGTLTSLRMDVCLYVYLAFSAHKPEKILRLNLANNLLHSCAPNEKLDMFRSIESLMSHIGQGNNNPQFCSQESKLEADYAIFAVAFVITFFVLLSKYSSFELDEPYNGSLAKAGIFFALISLAAWGGAAFFAWRRYEEGALTEFAPSYEQEFAVGVGGPEYGYNSSGAGVVVDSYQNAPFTAINTQGSPIDVKQFHQGY